MQFSHAFPTIPDSFCLIAYFKNAEDCIQSMINADRLHLRNRTQTGNGYIIEFDFSNDN
ncbi:hypothetical protein AN958_01535 [Leucoagaricus sp. SymC.cos]|nr:hypothetical protein AN958_01535 [Leucoagaricus sp. SymC.cos]